MPPRKSGNTNKSDVIGNNVDGSDNANNGIGIAIGEPVTVDPTSAVSDTGNGGSGGDFTGSTDSLGLTPTGRQRRKYGARGSRPAGNSPKEEIRVDIITQLLFSSCVMLSAVTATPELILEQSEAEQVAKAYGTLAEFYPVLQQSEKAVAWVNMLAALGMVFGTRAVAVYKRKKNDAENPDEMPGSFPSNMKVVK